jgi:hypothetical protein
VAEIPEGLGGIPPSLIPVQWCGRDQEDQSHWGMGIGVNRLQVYSREELGDPSQKEHILSPLR